MYVDFYRIFLQDGNFAIYATIFTVFALPFLLSALILLIAVLSSGFVFLYRSLRRFCVQDAFSQTLRLPVRKLSGQKKYLSFRDQE